jgi:5-hydroxyisourate hydrolase-like protein (transthyretin family)
MTKLARPIAMTAACLAVLGVCTAGVAGAAVGTAQPGSQTSIDRSVKPTSIPLKAAKSAVAPNQKVTLTGYLKGGHHPVANAPVTLESRQAGARTFTVVSAKTTDSNGKVTLMVAPGAKRGQKMQYELVFAGNTIYRGSHSQIITLTVS